MERKFIRLFFVEISPDSPTPTILFKEAVYNVLTLCSFFLHDFIDMDTLLRTRLIPEAAHPNQLSSLVLRRRLACVIEQWNDVKLSPEIRPLVFQVLVSLMGQDQATIVRLAAVKSLRAGTWNRIVFYSKQPPFSRLHI